MKPLWIGAAVLAVLVAHLLWIGPQLGEVARASLDEDARLALDLRCGEPTSGAARDCRANLERLYASGSLDPDRTLRAHCDEIRTAPWGRTHPALPRVCRERFGMR